MLTYRHVSREGTVMQILPPLSWGHCRNSCQGLILFSVPELGKNLLLLSSPYLPAFLLILLPSLLFSIHHCCCLWLPQGGRICSCPASGGLHREAEWARDVGGSRQVLTYCVCFRVCRTGREEEPTHCCHCPHCLGMGTGRRRLHSNSPAL